jgi:hypothetical protein
LLRVAFVAIRNRMTVLLRFCLQGPTISPVFTPPGDGNGAAGTAPDLFGTTICVPKKRLYAAVNELRKVLPASVCLSPMWLRQTV